MSKDLHNKMNEMIRMVKAKRNLDDKMLSLMLGKSEGYLSITKNNSKNNMLSDKQREIIIKKLDWLYKGGKGIAFDNHPEIFGKKAKEIESEILNKVEILKNESNIVTIPKIENLSLKLDRWLLLILVAIVGIGMILEFVIKSGILS